MKGHTARTCLLTSGLAIAAVLLTGCPKTPVLVPDSGPAVPNRGPRVPSGSASATGYVASTLLGDLHFDVDRADILPADRRVLDANVGWLRSNVEARLLLQGFADERGSTAYNRELGERRAAAVRDALIARGIDAFRISIRSHGEGQPLCAEQTDACWARNRRVQYLVSR